MKPPPLPTFPQMLSPPQPLLPSSLHRCPHPPLCSRIHTPGCCHGLCLLPGQSPHTVLRLRDPPVPAYGHPSLPFGALILLDSPMHMPFAPAGAPTPRPGHSHPPGSTQGLLPPPGSLWHPSLGCFLAGRPLHLLCLQSPSLGLPPAIYLRLPASPSGLPHPSPGRADAILSLLQQHPHCAPALATHRCLPCAAPRKTFQTKKERRKGKNRPWT